MKQKAWYEIKAAAAGRAEVFVYSEIGAWGISADQFARDLKALGDVREIDLHVNSPGGSVFEGMAMYTLLKNHPAQIYSYVDGVALSMGSVIALAGDVVSMPRNAFMMIHNPLASAYGEAKDLEKMAETLAVIKRGIVAIYTARTGRSDEEISALMDAETWMTGDDALAMGFVDEVTDEVPAAATFDFSKFQNAPDVLSGARPMPAVAGSTARKEGTMPIQNPVTTPAPNVVDESAVRAQALADEALRRADIRAAFGTFAEPHADLLATCLDDMSCSADDASRKLLAKLGKQSEPTNKDGRISVSGCDVQATFIAHAENAIAARAGIAKPIEDNALRNYSLFELARMALERRGVVTGHMDKMAIVAAAFTHSSSDFSTLLANTANKAMMKGYTEAQESFPLWTSVGNLPDFKSVTRVDLSAFPSLAQVREGAEFKSLSIGDRGEAIQLATYGGLFQITRQAIINDDLGAFSRIPAKMGAAAKRTVGDLVYAVLTSNAAMADGVALFHSTHANLAGSGSAIGTTSVDAGRAAMGVQTLSGAYLNIRPKFLICPVTKEGLAIQTMASEFEVNSGSKANTAPNYVRGLAQVISDARLSGNAWYLAADPAVFDTVEVAYLDGRQEPTLEQQNGWNVDGVEFKVRLDAAVKALDHRTLYKDPGA